MYAYSHKGTVSGTVTVPGSKSHTIPQSMKWPIPGPSSGSADGRKPLQE